MSTNQNPAFPEAFGHRGGMEPEGRGAVEPEVPGEGECRRIWQCCNTPEPVRRHCMAVRREAERIARDLHRAGCQVSLSVVQSAAMVHDAARTAGNHAREGAALLRREGYEAVAEVIACHHDLQCPDLSEAAEGLPPLWLEKAAVYLADKRVMEDRTVTLEERFEGSRRRCEQSADRERALAAHRRRYEEAKRIESLIRLLTDGGRES